MSAWIPAPPPESLPAIVKIRLLAIEQPMQLIPGNNSSDRVDSDDVSALFHPGRCSEQQLEIFAATCCQLMCVPVLLLAYPLQFLREGKSVKFHDSSHSGSLKYMSEV